MQEEALHRQQVRTGGKRLSPGHETASLPPKSLGQDALSTILGAPYRSRLHRPAVWDMRWVYLARLLYEVSNLGMGTDRSHAVGCRYRVCTRCMRPCWQTGHTDPGSPADTSGVLMSVASSRVGGRVVPQEGAALRELLLAHPVGQEAGMPQPVEATRWDVEHQTPQEFDGVQCQSASGGRAGNPCSGRSPWPSSKATSRWLEMATRWV